MQFGWLVCRMLQTVRVIHTSSMKVWRVNFEMNHFRCPFDCSRRRDCRCWNHRQKLTWRNFADQGVSVEGNGQVFTNSLCSLHPFLSVLYLVSHNRKSFAWNGPSPNCSCFTHASSVLLWLGLALFFNLLLKPQPRWAVLIESKVIHDQKVLCSPITSSREWWWGFKPNWSIRLWIYPPYQSKCQKQG